MKQLAWLGILGILVLGGVLLGRSLSLDPGTVLIYLHGYRVQFSVLTGLMAALLVVGLVWAGFTALRRPWAAYRGLRERRKNAQLTQGLLALASGQFSRAQSLLSTVQGDAATLAASRCLAADAARQSGDTPASRALLEDAAKHHKMAREMARLAAAREALQRGDAAACLERLGAAPAVKEPAAALLLRANALTALHRYDELLDLLTKSKSFPSGVGCATRMEHAAVGWLQSAKNAGEVARAWRKIPKQLRVAGPVLAAYVAAGIRHGAAKTVLNPALKALKAGPRPELVEALAETPKEHVSMVFKVLEPLGQRADADAGLLCTLGRLCSTADLLGQARHYFSASLAKSQQPKTHQYLGEVLERQGLTEQAMVCFKKALQAPLSLPSAPS